MNTPTVLLVEDDEENALLGTTLLKRLGVHVLHAPDGIRALKMAAQYTPDLILLDISMPGLTGLEVLEKLRADEKTKPLSVIMLTSRQFLPEFQKAQSLGAKGFLTKPYDLDAFLSRVCMELGIPMPKA